MNPVESLTKSGKAGYTQAEESISLTPPRFSEMQSPILSGGAVVVYADKHPHAGRLDRRQPSPPHPHLQLNIAQTAVLCGISVRQLGYWTKQGYVSASGLGARRMYGMDALRRILAIKNAMANGVSLRQALRVLPGPSAASSADFPIPSATVVGSLLAVTEALSSAAPRLSEQETDALTADLRALFDANRFTRDDASGLAVKVGRATADIRSVADHLCADGVLLKTISRGEAVFESAPKDRL